MQSYILFNDQPLSSDLLLAFLFSFCFVAARYILDKFMFQGLALWLSGKSRVKRIDAVTKATVVKCSESLWKLTYYGIVEFYVLKISYTKPWFTDTRDYFEAWPNQALSLPLKLYYMCQLGFYLYSIVALVTWETRRKDFAVMMSHHVVTVLLISLSFFTGFFRVGSIILALHDGSDVFMEAAKVFKYSGNELGASVFFGLFALSWFLLRLVFFPFWVIRSTSTQLMDYIDVSQSYERFLYYAFNTMLLMLLVFHIYWWILICAMIKRQLSNRGKVGEDIRSDSDDD